MVLDLAVVGPIAPMRRPYVDVQLGRSMHPISSLFPDREHQRVNVALFHHADLKVGVSRRN